MTGSDIRILQFCLLRRHWSILGQDINWSSPYIVQYFTETTVKSNYEQNMLVKPLEQVRIIVPLEINAINLSVESAPAVWTAGGQGWGAHRLPTVTTCCLRLRLERKALLISDDTRNVAIHYLQHNPTHGTDITGFEVVLTCSRPMSYWIPTLPYTTLHLSPQIG